VWKKLYLFSGFHEVVFNCSILLCTLQPDYALLQVSRNDFLRWTIDDLTLISSLEWLVVPASNLCHLPFVECSSYEIKTSHYAKQMVT